MQNTPGDYLIQQFNTLKAMFEDKLLIESIEPSYTNKLLLILIQFLTILQEAL